MIWEPFTLIVIALAFAFVIYVIALPFRMIFGGRGKVDPQGALVCLHCGSRGRPATRVRGSLAIEILAWLLFIIPGIFYSLWRLSSKIKVCPACGEPDMIQINTPRGRKFLNELSESPHPDSTSYKK